MVKETWTGAEYHPKPIYQTSSNLLANFLKPCMKNNSIHFDKEERRSWHMLNYPKKFFHFLQLA